MHVSICQQLARPYSTATTVGHDIEQCKCISLKISIWNIVICSNLVISGYIELYS